MKTKSNLKLELFDFSKSKKSADSPATPKKKGAAVAKPKQSSPKKKPATPKKNATIFVKVTETKKKYSIKGSPAKGKKGKKAVPAKKSKK